MRTLVRERARGRRTPPRASTRPAARPCTRCGPRHHGTGGAWPLHRWPPGTRLRVIHIGATHAGGRSAASATRKFAALGILPGSAITLVQTTPLPVIAVGNSVFAIDRAAASTVICVEDVEDADTRDP